MFSQDNSGSDEWSDDADDALFNSGGDGGSRSSSPSPSSGAGDAVSSSSCHNNLALLHSHPALESLVSFTTVKEMINLQVLLQKQDQNTHPNNQQRTSSAPAASSASSKK